MKTFLSSQPVQSQPKRSSTWVIAVPPCLRPTLLGLAVTLGGATAALAQQGAPVKVIQADVASLRVRLDNAAPQRCQVRVVQLSSGNLLFEETQVAGTYGHRFNFQNLPTGQYTLQIRIGPNRYRYTVAVKTQAPHATTAVVRELSTRQELTASQPGAVLVSTAP